MHPSSANSGARRRGLLAAACASAAVIALVYVPPASADWIGKPISSPKPNCPQVGEGRVPPAKRCYALGSVTGFQTRAQGVQNPFRIRRNGHIVAWRVRLSRPDRSERSFFGNLFGTEALGRVPTAQIAILRRLKNGKFRLVRRGPVVDLSRYYGERPVITLNEPLRVRKGQIVALTTPTWIPNFVSTAKVRNSIWRASRPGSKCGDDFATRAKPHRKVGSDRNYGCRFTDRLLYWAYFRRS
ncbi:MAG TPA: hypothetical protein VK919_15220 [Solirubrobacterales bacterium]|nr:hypothetical protein [Solirubrobacterales bacterium]